MSRYVGGHTRNGVNLCYLYRVTMSTDSLLLSSTNPSIRLCNVRTFVTFENDCFLIHILFRRFKIPKLGKTFPPTQHLITSKRIIIGTTTQSLSFPADPASIRTNRLTHNLPGNRPESHNAGETWGVTKGAGRSHNLPKSSKFITSLFLLVQWAAIGDNKWLIPNASFRKAYAWATFRMPVRRAEEHKREALQELDPVNRTKRRKKVVSAAFLRRCRRYDLVPLAILLRCTRIDRVPSGQNAPKPQLVSTRPLRKLRLLPGRQFRLHQVANYHAEARS
jgi:hypothetical protein